MSVNYADLVWVNTATTGTGAITPGSALAGYLGASTLTSGASYNYSISDQNGSAFETGYGTWNGSSISRNVYESSNNNSALSLSGSAIVIIGSPLAADLNAMNVQAWPFFKGAWTGNQTVSGGAFSTLPVNAVTDTSGAWSSSNNWWTVPVTATYQIFAKHRIQDGSTSGTSGISMGIGVDYQNADSADFFWGVTNGNRNGLLNFRTDVWTAGQQLRLFAYFDGFSPTLIETSLVIYRVR